MVLTFAEYELIAEGYFRRISRKQDDMARWVAYLVNCWTTEAVSPEKLLGRPFLGNEPPDEGD